MVFYEPSHFLSEWLDRIFTDNPHKINTEYTFSNDLIFLLFYLKLSFRFKGLY
ncbi:hypothetical protein KL86SPO_20501 [uncultured Sporomusa sp.]|uniref:Uncharacterized protein n=1 Tax=uncultured Sporomusa sp. TaxID=307249 RepID=A0A212LP45_9FIRM|nr:hypothetical protein KL86SPO_20501 [uncultured Sporomusa sp.]